MIDKLGLIQPSVTAASPKATGGATALTKSFGSYLNDALQSISAQESKVDSLNESFAAGNTSDVHTLMIESEKASLGLELTVQVRDKVIEAYQDVMRMQL